MKRNGLTFATFIALCLSVSAQGVTYPVAINEQNFPGEIFRNMVLSDYDSNHDGYLSVEEAQNVTEINISQRSDRSDVKDITGIEYFPELKTLMVTYSGITSLDVTHNTKLVNLVCAYCDKIPELDVTHCPNLEALECTGNKIASLDVTNCPKLTELRFSRNDISSIDLTNCHELKILDACYLQMTSIDVTQCPKLEELYLSNTSISELDVTHCPSLTILFCSNTKLSRLDISKCNLNNFWTMNTQLVAIDMSHGWFSHTDLNYGHTARTVKLDGNNSFDMTSLYDDGLSLDNVSIVSGGTLDGSTLTFTEDKVVYNYKTGAVNPDYPNLVVWLVADRLYEDGLLPIDEQNFPDKTFRELLRTSDYDRDGDGKFSAAEIDAIKTLILNDMSVKDLTGIEFLRNIEVLELKYTDVEKLDMSCNHKLNDLKCSQSKVSSLNLKQCPELITLYCYGSQLPELDLSGNPKLFNLFCDGNKLTKLDLSANNSVKYLDCGKNNLVALDLSNIELRSTDIETVSNVRNVTLAEGNKLDLTMFAEDGLDVSRIINVEGGNLEGNILTFTAQTAKYTYDTKALGSNAPVLAVKLISDNFDSVEDITADNRDNISVDGRLVTADTHMRVYGISGALIAEGSSIELPAAGMYIVKTAGSVSKIVVR